MKKYKFVLNTGMAGGTETEVVELPKEYTESEVEGEFKEWVWDQLDAFYVELEGEGDDK